MAPRLSRRAVSPASRRHAKRAIAKAKADPPRPCAVHGCGKDALAFGRYCKAHNNHRWRHGTALAADRLAPEVISKATPEADRWLSRQPPAAISKALAELSSLKPATAYQYLHVPAEALKGKRRQDVASVVWAHSDPAQAREWLRIALAHHLAYLRAAPELGQGIADGLTQRDLETAIRTTAGSSIVSLTGFQKRTGIEVPAPVSAFMAKQVLAVALDAVGELPA